MSAGLTGVGRYVIIILTDWSVNINGLAAYPLRIMDAAITVFSRTGYHRTKIKNVTDEAGVPFGARHRKGHILGAWFSIGPY